MATTTRDFPGMHPSVAPSWIPPSMTNEAVAEEVRNLPFRFSARPRCKMES